MSALPRTLAFVLLLLLIGATSAQRQVETSTTPDFPLDAVQRGASGYALTAGAGNVIERFEVTVLGVQPDAGNGFPLVLIRASGPFIERVGGVAAGMSGSPVYLRLNGRDALLGAIGYVFPEADHSVALVTPIGAMRDEAVVADMPAAPVVAGYGRAVRVATPILLNGAGPRVAALLEPLFSNVALTPFPTQAAGVATSNEPYSLEPGAAIAVRLMSGDLDLSAIGTLTTLEARAPDAAAAAVASDAGDAATETLHHSFLAFGHPFLGTGSASYSVSGAHVLEIVASDSVPFKLANTAQEQLGAVRLDTPTALHGVVGASAATVPLSLSVSAGGRQQRFEVNLAADDQLYPTLTAIASLQAADRLLRGTGAGHAALAWEIELSGGRRLNVLEQTSSDSDIAYAAAVLAGGPLAILATNAFDEPGLESIALSIELTRDRNSATIESLVLEEEPVQAGDNAVLHVRLQPYRRPALVRTFSVPLPAEARGELTLLVRGGDVPRDIDGVPEEGGEVDEPRSFPELLDALRQQLQAAELVVEVIDEYGEVSRLLRTSLPFVVLGSEELQITVGGDEEQSEEQSEGQSDDQREDQREDQDSTHDTDDAERTP